MIVNPISREFIYALGCVIKNNFFMQFLTIFMQFGQKLHAHAIFRCMQFHQDGCRSTRLDFRNHVLWDESSGQNKKSLFFKNKIRLYFPLYFLKFPLYLQKWLALSEIVILGPETFFGAFWYLSPWPTKIGARNSKKLILWHTLICMQVSWSKKIHIQISYLLSPEMSILVVFTTRKSDEEL